MLKGLHFTKIHRNWLLPAIFLAIVIGSGNRIYVQFKPIQVAHADGTRAGTPPGDAAAWEAQQRDRRQLVMRGFMSSRGMSDKTTQDAILAYLESQETARQPLLTAGFRLLPALYTSIPTDTKSDSKIKETPPPIPEEQAKTLVAQYQEALQKYEAQRVDAQKDLDTKIGFTKHPRIQALLFVLGGLDHGPQILPIWNPIWGVGTLPPPAKTAATTADHGTH